MLGLAGDLEAADALIRVAGREWRHPKEQAGLFIADLGPGAGRLTPRHYGRSAKRASTGSWSLASMPTSALPWTTSVSVVTASSPGLTRMWSIASDWPLKT